MFQSTRSKRTQFSTEKRRNTSRAQKRNATTRISSSKSINTAIHTFLLSRIQPDLSWIHPRVDILSVQSRGITLAGYNDAAKRRSVIRVSRCANNSVGRIVSARDISGPTKYAQRIHLFGKFMASLEKNIPGIVPFVQEPTIVEDTFLIEQYEEIVCDSGSSGRARRLDLHTFVMENMDGNNARRGFGYLHDVLCGIVELHRHGWAHMDLSLENVVLSNDHAYLVDFESVLPFYMEPGSSLKRREIGVPLKAPFVPVEHFVSNKNDLLNLPSYDVWAFGIMFFLVLFREYLFSMRSVTDPDSGKQFMMPTRAQIDYFMAKGFRAFCRKYHPDKFMLMFETSRVRCKPRASVRFKLDERVSNYLQLCGDLLTKIFQSPKVVVLSDEIQNKNTNDSGSFSRYFCTCERFTAQNVFDHPFWEVHGIR